MHKKLAADLTSLAHSILQMKNKDDVFALKEKAHEVYEKLSVLAYVEEYINNTPNPEHTKEELLEKIEQATEKVAAAEAVTEAKEEVVVHNLEEVAEDASSTIEETTTETLEETTEDAEAKSIEVPQEEPVEEDTKEEVEEDAILEIEPALVEVKVESETEPVSEADEENKNDEGNEEEATILELVLEPEEVEAEPTLETEIQEEVIEEKKEEPEPVAVEEAVSKKKESKKAPSLDEELKDTISVDVVADLFENAPKKSLNDRLHGDIQIGLNDRIAFVKNLFEGSQEDFNRVVSQLNTFKTEKDAKKFINKMVKPDYDWSEKEEYEERFMSIVARKFA